ncbi:MAG: hypothetical protein K6B41_14500 [Butyrivibrio sp.]|nr:hypothetical protein [Butyrivibrio sp.]
MAITEYECPACGGTMAFDAATQMLKCEYCDTKIKVSDYVAPHAHGPEATAANEWQASETEGMFVYTCQSCGGEIIADENLGSSQCPFCGNNVVMKDKFEGGLKPDYIIPFKKSKEEAMNGYHSFIKGKPLLPKVFSDENHIDKIRGIYVPYWLYDAKLSADITYEGTKVRTWRDSDYNYTDTSFFHIERAGTEVFEHIPVDGSKEMPDNLMESLEPFDFKEVQKFEGAFLAGFIANKYDVEEKDCRPRARQRAEEQISANFRNSVIGYSTVRETSKNISERSFSHKYALYPVWVLNTTWRDNHYMFAMNGQTGKFIGDLPSDKGAAVKYFLAFGLAFSVIMFIINCILQIY